MTAARQKLTATLPGFRGGDGRTFVICCGGLPEDTCQKDCQGCPCQRNQLSKTHATRMALYEKVHAGTGIVFCVLLQHLRSVAEPRSDPLIGA